ncbi:pentatricopeptide repeat-containing protein At4g21065-like [Macadamia integrifolia]|uniref:pentatricopeptide repeat-containing protein At4g21065-like n=1 Tax=Macadamia integrifolia TaxID=60698 RepID=UPI001C534089|nr:pentatricopeptide repeat-containing protein At4g21065-like [Macadamia integrifolia]
MAGSLFAHTHAMEIGTMTQAMQLHAQMIKTGKQDNFLDLNNLFTFSALSTSGDLTYARQVFNSIQTPNSYFWNTMIRGYAKSPEPDQALLLFLAMQLQEDAPNPDNYTFPFLLKSCTRLHRTREGRQLHAVIYKAGLQSDRFVQNSLIHMYSSCGESSFAMRVFEKMSDRNVVSWTSMIDGLVDDDRPVEALRMFARMEDDGVAPNDATVVSVLRACADVGAMGIGQKVHKMVEHREIASKANVCTALIDMYAKCGCIDSARRVFDTIVNKDVFAWTAMLSGLASHGRSKEAIDLFNELIEANLKPDVRTVTAVLSACRNAGWVTEGYHFFNDMEMKYGIRPTIQHYGCVVDLLARAGHLKDAEEFIKNMPVEPDAVLWRTLIWACRVYGDTERGERLTSHLQPLKTDSNDCGSYVLLGNVYALAGKWREKAKVRKLMNKQRLSKPPGTSRVEVNGVIHEFVAGDSSHPEAERIYRRLDEIAERLREEGHHPKVSEVLLDIEDEEKVTQLQHHSEKLAVAFGLINSSTGTPIRVVKNLRSCADCHSVMKLVSKIYQQEIVIRDRIRFHHFKNGQCSCGDYW